MDLGKLARQSSLYLVGNVASRAVGFFMVPVYAHFLTPAEYGTVELLELFLQVVVISVGIQALGGSMIRIYHDYQGEAQEKVVSSAMLSALAAGSIVAAVVLMFAEPASVLLFKSPAYAGLIRAAFVAMVFATIAEMSIYYHRLRDRVAFVVTYSLVQLAASLGLNIYFIAFREMGVLGFVLAKLITASLGGAFLAWTVLREVPLRWDWNVTRKLTGFGAPLMMTGAGMFVIHFSDRFFISHFTTLAEVGIYSLAYKFGFLVSYLVGEPFGNVWNVTLYGHTRRLDWRQQAGRAALYLTFFLFLVGIGLVLALDVLLPVMVTSSFAGAGALIPILVLGYITREIGDFFRTTVYVNKRAGLISVITGACAVLNIGLNWMLIPRWGATGAAWCTLVTWFAYMCCCWAAANHEHRIPFRVTRFAQILMVALAIYAARQLVPGQTAPVQMLIQAAFVALFCGLLLLVGYVPREERTNLAGLVQRLLWKTT